MPELPKSTRITLLQARPYIGERVGKDGKASEVGNALHRALCENSLSAEAQYQQFKSKNTVTTIIPADVWKNLSYSSFLSAASNECVQVDTKGKYRKYSPRYHNPSIATADIDNWLANADKLKSSTENTAPPSDKKKVWPQEQKEQHKQSGNKFNTRPIPSWVNELIDAEKKSPSETKKPRGNRGVKSIASDDALLDEMHKMIKDGTDAIDTAAESLVSKAKGDGTSDSKRRRLARKFTFKYGSDIGAIRKSV